MSGTTSSKKLNIFWVLSMLATVVVFIIIVVIVTGFTSGSDNTKGEYHLGYSTSVDGLSSGIYMVCESEPCRRTGFAEWIRLDSSATTVTVQVENVSKAQAYAEVDANGILMNPLTSSIDGDYVTIALPEGQTSFLLWVTTNNNDPYGIVE